MTPALVTERRQRFSWRALLVGLTLSLALIATGCIGFEEQVSFNADGSGTLQITFGIDVETLEALEAESTAPDPVTEAERQRVRERFGPNATLEPFIGRIDGREFTGQRLRIPFFSPDDFNRVLVALSETASDEDTDVEDSDMDLDDWEDECVSMDGDDLDENMAMDGDECMDGTDEDDGSDDSPVGELSAKLVLSVNGGTYVLSGFIPPLFSEDGGTDESLRPLMETGRRLFTITLPGQVTAADADSRQGQTYTWRQDPLAAQPRTVNVTWNPAGSSSASVNPVPPPGAGVRPTSTPAATPTRAATPTTAGIPVATATVAPTQAAASPTPVRTPTATPSPAR
jgi:hypothetical protein